jgi:tetratricopeptide (TPR) repeat protein
VCPFRLYRNVFQNHHTLVQLQGASSVCCPAALVMLCCCFRYNAQAHVNRGVVLLEAGSLEEALQAFSDAAAIQPLNVQALYNLG